MINLHACQVYKDLWIETKWIALEPEDVRYNGGQRCDMLSGPCSCGAWHNMPKKIIKPIGGGDEG